MISSAAVTKPLVRVARSLRNDGVSGMTSTIRHGLRWRANRVKRRRRPPAPTKASPAPDVVSAHATLEPSAGPGQMFPRVTIIVTTLNRSSLIPIALRSLQLQDFEAWECVVVDDGSTDDTVAVAQRFVDADHRFRLVRHDRRRGLSAARNTGIALARGEFICFLDDDDFLLEGSVRARLASLEGSAPDVAASFCDWINTNPDVGLEAFTPKKSPKKRGQLTFASLREGPPFIATSPLLRREVLLSVGGFDEGYQRAEDSELWHRILRLGYRFVDAGHVGVAYRRTPNSMVLGDPRAQILTLREIESRADADGTALLGHGPRPVVEPLSSLAADALRAHHVYRYLAMMSLRDLEGAVALGVDLLPDPIRAEIEPSVLTAQLVSYVKARCSIRLPDDLFALETSVRRLVTELIPPVAETWRPLIDIEPWIVERESRRTDIGPTPQVVQATEEAIDGAVVLVIEAIYHVAEFGPLHDELKRRGQKCCFMMSPKTMPAALSALGEFVDTVWSFDIALIRHAAAVVVLNDWGPVRALVEAADQAGVATFAKVEGVQDFEDVDTGRRRDPYRTAAIILGQGENDAKALPDKRVEIVGSSRLERIWLGEPAVGGEHALVNLNFTYHVLTDRRSEWMDSVVRGLRKSRTPGVVSCHPAERSRPTALPLAEAPFRHEITRAGLLISRFSTVPFEAMAHGVPFVYHNPHDESVPTFKNPAGAFAVTATSEELAAAVGEWMPLRGASYREVAAPFFLAHIDVDPSATSAERTADVVIAAISG